MGTAICCSQAVPVFVTRLRQVVGTICRYNTLFGKVSKQAGSAISVPVHSLKTHQRGLFSRLPACRRQPKGEPRSGRQRSWVGRQHLEGRWYAVRIDGHPDRRALAATGATVVKASAADPLRALERLKVLMAQPSVLAPKAVQAFTATRSQVCGNPFLQSHTASD